MENEIGILEQSEENILSSHLSILWKGVFQLDEVKIRLCIWEACQIRSEISEAKVVKKKLWNTGTVIFEIYLKQTSKKQNKTRPCPKHKDLAN